MFDVQVLREKSSPDPLSEETLASIAGYYRRVTTDARPMNLLIALVMLTTLLGCVLQLIRGEDSRWISGMALALCFVPITLAQARIIRNAVRLGEKRDDRGVQSHLARGIYRDHVVCFAAIVMFTGLQLSMAFR